MKKGMKSIKVLLACLMLLAVFPIQVFAAGPINTNQDITFNISYKDGAKVIPDARFTIYRVADVDKYADMTLTAEFEAYKNNINGLADLENLTQESWLALASTLRGYVLKDDITPVAEGKTDSDGNLAFSNLKVGLYLVIGNRVTTGDYYTYSAAPFMVFLPGEDSVNNDWDYEVTAAPKYSKDYYPPDDDDTISRKVLKVWEDDGDTAARPSEISVSLLCDGNIYETVTLNAGNNWRFEWTRLPANHEWLVTETAVAGYTMRVEQNGVTFVITNTTTTPPPDEEDIDEPPVPLGGLEFEEGEDGDEELVYLPQTGSLWWPVPLMLCLGIILLMLGTVYRRRDEK